MLLQLLRKRVFFSEMLDVHAYSRKIRVSRSPHTSLSPDESAAVQIHLEFNSTRKHFCQKTAIFSLYRREREVHTCLPNQNAKTFDRANKEGGTGGREKGRMGGLERGKRGAGEGRKGEGEGRKGGGRREGGRKG